MKKIFNLQFLLLIICSVLFSSFIQQAGDENQIFWSNSGKLTWSEYIANPDMQDTSNVALTYYGISCSMKTKGDSVVISVRAIFDKSKSWVRPNEKSDSLLIHEQGHFDMSEIYSRILKKTLKEKKFKKATLSTEFNELYKSNVALLNAEQGVYDEETNHGRIASKQIEWNKKIQGRLSEYESFSRDKVTALLIR